jgi:hypothetical protein
MSLGIVLPALRTLESLQAVWVFAVFSTGDIASIAVHATTLQQAVAVVKK